MKRLILISVCLACAFTGFTQKSISLEDIWAKGTFRLKSINEIRSMNNGDDYCILTLEGIDRYEYKTGKRVETIIRFSDLDFGNNSKNRVFDYNFSNDEKKILLATDPEFIYRHSFLANYYIYELETKINVKDYNCS